MTFFAFSMQQEPQHSIYDVSKNLQSYVEIENLGPVSWALEILCLSGKREKALTRSPKKHYVGDLLEKHQVVVSEPQQVPFTH